MNKTITLTFTEEEARTICGNLHAYACHLKMQAIRNGNEKQFDKGVKASNELSGRFYKALTESLYTD